MPAKRSERTDQATERHQLAATSGGQTVNVTPGATIELRPQSPPQTPVEHEREKPPQEPREPTAVGAAPTDVQQLKEQLRAADEKIAALTAALATRPADDASAPRAEPGNVSPSALERFRVSGEKNVVPDDGTKAAIAQAGTKKIIGSFKLCLDTSGSISSIKRLKSTGFDAYDRLIEQKMHDWRYRPFLIDGKPTAVCTAVTFIYKQVSEPEDDRSSTVKHATSTAPVKPCDSMNVDDMMTQSANQYSAGYAKAALSLVEKALSCKQDTRMYRTAAMYACAAHDLPTAQTMFAKLPAQFQAQVEQKCQQEGLYLKGP